MRSQIRRHKQKLTKFRFEWQDDFYAASVDLENLYYHAILLLYCLSLLILDEVFDSSLDEAGTDYFTKIIKFVVKDSNTFVISHKVDDLLEKFDETIKFEKKKGFSMMVESD